MRFSLSSGEAVTAGGAGAGDGSSFTSTGMLALASEATFFGLMERSFNRVFMVGRGMISGAFLFDSPADGIS